ncbi:GCD complex subunit gcd7 [Rhizina undulata]
MTSQMVTIHTPGLKWWLKHLETEFDPAHSVDLFIGALKRRSICNPTPCAIGTAQLFLRLISAYRFSTIRQLVDYVSSIETQLSSARPREFSISNMCRRVIGIIREEAENNGLGESFRVAIHEAGIYWKFYCSTTTFQRVVVGKTSLVIYSDQEIQWLYGPLRRADSTTMKTTTSAPATTTAKTPTSATSLKMEHFTGSRPGTGKGFAAGGANPSVTSLFDILSHPSSPNTTSAASSPPQSGTSTPIQPHLLHQNTSQRDIRPSIIQDIQELIEELDSIDTNLAESALSIVNASDIILTYGLPTLVHKLLLRAAQKRRFTVVVAEGSPNIREHTHAAVMGKIHPDDDDDQEDSGEAAVKKSLQDRGVTVIVTSDSDITSFMPRVNRVLLGCDYVLADGSIIADAGTAMVARVAKFCSKPVVVVAGSHMMTPVIADSKWAVVTKGPPVVVGFHEGELLEKVEFCNPLTELVDGEKLDMFVTNNGIIAPAAMHRSTLELYHMPEAELFHA